MNPTRLIVLLALTGHACFAAPVFTSASTANVNEGVGAGTTVYTAVATESGHTVTYSLSGADASAFTINSTIGVVTINSIPDFETKSSYSFAVIATDELAAFSTLAVTLSVNDLPPVITSGTQVSVNEGIPANSTVYTAIASDPAGGTVNYSLSGTDASAFTINSSTGAVTINNSPNFETKSSYNFNIKASDPSGDLTTEAVTININDLPPVISSSTTANVNEDVAPNSVVYTTIASDPAGGTVTYSLTGTDASAFTINSVTGAVTINNTPDFETKSSYSFNVKASDPSGSFNIQAVTLSVNDLPPVITSSSIANVNEGVAANSVVYTATASDPAGGTVLYALTGTDASAFTINSSIGVVTINAVPHYEIKSSYSFNIKASDPGGAFNTQALTVTVNPIIASTVPELNGVSVSGNGGFGFSFTNLANADFVALASTNLTLPSSNWTVLGVITDSPPGQYQFSDTQATNNVRRFYRVRSP